MRTQRGVGLVEMMVAVTIGLVLLLGLGTVFVSLKQTSDLRLKMSTVQNNERLAMMFLATSIRNAGYYPTPAAVAGQINLVAPFTQAISGIGTGVSGADTFSVSFVPPPTGVSTAAQGCTANLNAGDTYTDTFSVTGGNLVCTEQAVGAAGTTTTTVNLITGLTGMNVNYGVDTVGNGSVTEYMPANSVTTLGYWASVKTVVIQLIFNNSLAGQPGQPATVSLQQTIAYSTVM